MKKLPLLISVPHGGFFIPEEVRHNIMLSEEDIRKDSDEGASEIYSFKQSVDYHVSTEVARAVIDVNRPVDDRSTDGVVKTHTCRMVKVYRDFPDEKTIGMLLEKYYWPYHHRLTKIASQKPVMGIDCHTMMDTGPPVARDAGKKRPHVCISTGNGTCPESWATAFVDKFKNVFGPNVAVNEPFKGGHIIRTHASEIPWIQLELSRAAFMTDSMKREKVLKALTDWVEWHDS